MAYQKKEGDISVFRQENANPKAPQWKGDALINGVVMEVAFWEKSGTMMTGVIKPKGQKRPPVEITKPKPTTEHDFADEVPW